MFARVAGEWAGNGVTVLRIRMRTRGVITRSSPDYNMASTKPDPEASALHENPSTQPKADLLQNRGGYDCQFIGEIPQDGQCPICHLIYRHPHQMRCCGKRICAGCVENIKASKKPCPLCNEAEVSSYLDKACIQLLNNYKVNCPNNSEGCEWEGQFCDLENHLNLEPTTEKQLEGCPFSKIKCRFCFKLFERHIINNHQSTECSKRLHMCAYCEYSASFEDMTQHSQVCPSAPVTCPNNCEIAVLRRNLEHHQNHDCPLEIQQCDFRAFGCQVELPRREMSDHKRQSVAEHSVALSTTLQKAMADNTSLQSEMQERMNAQSQQMKYLTRGVVLLAVITLVAMAMLTVMLTMQSGQHSIDGKVNKTQSRDDQIGFCIVDERDTIDRLETKKRQNAILKRIQPQEDVLPFEFLMKDFEKHKRDGSDWFSPPFYTDIYGYKMCIRVEARGKAERYISVCLSDGWSS